ncbi:GEVED domain-containing protein [Flavobacterium subsaxonicum]|nr:GEVED domain-containing protein [Flavobacterium subsaxonicum]
MKINLRHLFFGVMLAFAGANAQDYEHLTVTGYNADVIANGVGTALSSISLPVDNANYCFMSNDFLPSTLTTPPTYGLPAAGLITSLVSATPGLTYQMASLSANNALRFGATAGLTTGSISFTNAVEATKLFVLATSGSGASTCTAVITFDDGTTQDVASFIVPDWFNSTTQPIAAQGFGRVNTTNNVVESGNGTNPRLYQITFNIDIANQAKAVSSIAFTKTSTGEGVVNVFGVTAQEVPACPVISGTSSATASTTSGIISWTLATAGQGTAATNYTLEVYTDAGYTTPIAGSPFTNITATSYTLTGLTFETPYYYRVKANNGTCDSAYVTGTFSPAFCVPTKSGTSTAYYITNVATTGGYTNIANATAASATAGYTNYSAAQIVSKPAGTTFDFSITRGSTSTTLGVWVDWNNDLDFDDAGETIGTYVGGFNGQALTVTGSIAIPAATPVGNYRLRVRSTYYFNTTVVPCGALLYGEAEDYNISVVTPPADCTTPDAPVIVLSSVTATGLTADVTMPTTAPTGYIVVRSTAALTAQPATGSVYAVGANLGGGKVISAGATISTFTDFLNNNTHYYYFIYAYNENGSSCFGPKYSVAGTADATTCAGATTAVGAFDVTAASANLTWTSIVGAGGAAATYTVEVYTDAALTALFGTFTTANTTYALTGLTNGSTYYFRVKAETASCDNDAWSSAVSFVAENNFTPLSLTGFNADVIANGNGVANLSTTNAVDAVDNAYMSIDYKANATSAAATFGLPVNRRLTGNVAGLTLLLQDYSANNSLRIPAQNQVGTLTLATPVKASNLYFGVTSGSGTATISAQVLFSDGTSQTASGLSVLNWDNAATAASPAIANAIGRVNRANTVGAPDGPGAFKVFQLTVNIDADNQSKLITGVTFTKTSTGATEPVPHVFAISAKTIDECPVLAATTATGLSNGATIATVLTADSGAPTSYTVEIYTDAAFTTPVTGSPFTGITAATYTASGLSPLTTYYYRVKALNSTCVSDYVTGTFTTLDGCTTPAVPTAAPQTVCSGATVANLVATPVTGATIKWYATETGGDVLASTAVVTAGTYYVSQQIDVCESARLAVVVTVTTTPVPVVESELIFCPNTAISEVSIGPATLNWYNDEYEAIPLTTILETATYYVTQTLNGCESAFVTVTVEIDSTTPTAPVAQTLCNGATVGDIEITTPANTTFNWTFNGVAVDDDAVLVSGTYVVTQTFFGCTSLPLSIAVTVTTVAQPVGPAAQTVCAGTLLSELDITALENGTLNWTFNGLPVVADAVLVSGTYVVTQAVGDCESTPKDVVVTVTEIASVDAAETQTFCFGATVADLDGTAATGATLIWSATSGGTALADTAVLASGTYFVWQTLGTCASEVTEVTVVVNTTPALSIDDITLCGAATVADLNTENASVTWYASETGPALEETATVTTGSYFVTQTLNGCESPRAEVGVVVNALSATPTGAATQTFTTGETVADLEVTTTDGATVVWYVGNDIDGYTVIPTTTVLEDGVTYYVSQATNGCESELLAVTADQVAATSSFNKASLKVYPNPTTDVVTVSNNTAISKVTVINLLGQTVISQTANTDTVQVNLASLSAGTYILQITAEGASANVKVVKQ